MNPVHRLDDLGAFPAAEGLPPVPVRGPGAPLPFTLPRSIPTLERILFVHHLNMVADPRLDGWIRALEALPEDLVVAELGCGSGILSMVAARRARRVYAVELDDDLLAFAQGAARLNGLEDRIVFVQGDAREVRLPERVDAVFCEMLDTGLICEMQVEVMARVHELLAPGGSVIPQRVDTFAELVWTDYEFHGIRLPMPFFQTTEARESHDGFGPRVLAHEAIFDGREIPLEVSVRLPMPVERGGVVNSFRLTSDTQVMPGVVLPGSHWLNPPLVFPFEPVEVHAGDAPVLSLSYRLSGGLRTLDYRLEQ